MRKKLSLFLVMLMALTMVLGTGITAMAAELPAGAPLSVRPCTDSTNTSALYYVTGIEGDKVKVVMYHHDDGDYYTGSGEQEQPCIAFGDLILVGRVYHLYAGKYYFCNDNLPLDPVVIAECGNNEHQYLSHFYSYGTLNPEGDKVLGAYYYKSSNVCGHNDDASLLKSLFDGDYGEGWYYAYSAETGGRATWYRCSGPHGITPVNPYNSNPDPNPDPTPEPPEGAPSSVRACSDTTSSLYYVLENNGGEKVKTVFYKFNGELLGAPIQDTWVWAFSDPIIVGRVYHDYQGALHFCNDNLPEYDTENWVSDENSHWHAAVNGAADDVIDKAAHTWDAGKVTKEATVDSTGVMTYTCSVCKAVKTVEIPKLTPTVAPTSAPKPVIVIIIPQEIQESQGTSETQGATESQGSSETQGTAGSADTPDAEDGKTSETEKDEEDGRTSETEEGEKAAAVETVKSNLAEVFTENKVAVTEQKIESAVPATKKNSAYYDESGKKITNSFIETSDGNLRYVGTTGKSVKKAVVATVDAATGEMKMYYAGKNGVIVKNKVVTLPDGGKIFASADGTLATNEIVTSGKHQYYADENGKLLTNQIIKTEDGTRYYANKYGRIRKNALFTAPDGDKRYATADGTLAKSCWVTVGKKMYWCNKIGRITKSKPVEGN